MTTVTLTPVDFEEAIASNDMLVVDFWASWCVPCRQFAPIYHAVADETDDITLASFQTDAGPEYQEVFEELGLRAVPSLLWFKSGYLIDITSGGMNKADLRTALDTLRQFDVNQAIAAAAESSTEETAVD